MKKKGIILIFSSFLLLACKSDNQEVIDGLSQDTIGLSEKNIYFDSSKSSEIILTKGKKWWITSIETNEKIITPEYTANTFLNNIKITDEWFQVERVDSQTIVIEVIDNVYERPREFSIVLQSNDYFDYVLVKQEGCLKSD